MRTVGYSIPPEIRRERDRDQKRRKRAALRALGLNSSGEPVKDPVAQARSVAANQHPRGCPCYDCLWGNTESANDEYAPTIYRARIH